MPMVSLYSLGIIPFNDRMTNEKECTSEMLLLYNPVTNGIDCFNQVILCGF